MNGPVDINKILGGGALKPVISVVSEGERLDGLTSVGLSKYIIFLPSIQRMLGMTVKIVAAPNKPTSYTVTCTDIYKDSESIMRALYRESQ